MIKINIKHYIYIGVIAPYIDYKNKRYWFVGNLGIRKIEFISDNSNDFIYGYIYPCDEIYNKNSCVYIKD